MVMSLDDLRAEVEAEDDETNAQTGENAEVETKTEQAPQASEDEIETEAADEKTQEAETDADPETDDGENAAVEDWMAGDDHAPEAGKTFSNNDMAGLRKKLQAKSDLKIEDKNSEIEKLRLENEALRANAPAAANILTRPKRDDFYDEDDPEEAFTDALVDYKLAKSRAEQSAEVVATGAVTQAEKRQQVISSGENAHYDRALELVVKSKISAEKYQAADLAFRQAINDVVPGGGDNITAGLVNALGNGSEKVVFNVGINQQRLNKIKELLIGDPSGLSLMSHLSDKKNTLIAAKSNTSAPAPAPGINGDVTDSAGEKDMIKQFNAAEKSGDQQKMMDIMSTGRRKGYETKTW